MGRAATWTSLVGEWVLLPTQETQICSNQGTRHWGQRVGCATPSALPFITPPHMITPLHMRVWCTSFSLCTNHQPVNPAANTAVHAHCCWECQGQPTQPGTITTTILPTTHLSLHRWWHCLIHPHPQSP
jgi:hypothetical protein